MWMLCWRWRRPSSRQLRRSRRSFDRLNSRFERQAAARLRDSCGADGAAVATPAVAARPRVGPRGLQRGHPQARASASPSLAARGSAARRGTEPTPNAAPAAERARSAEPQVSRAATFGEAPEAPQLGGTVESIATGSDAALTAPQLGARQAMRAAGLARHGSASRRMLIPENSRGCGLRCFVLPHLGDARTVVVQDGYVRTQLERLRELAEMARSCGVRRIEVIAKPWRPDDADATASDPLLALADSVGGIEWSLRTSTVHHDRQIKILHDSGGVTVDLGRGLDMYYAAQSRHEDQTNSDTLRARETVVWTRVWTSRDAAPAQSSKHRGTTAAAQDLSTRPTRKLRRLAQRLRALARAHCAGQLLDAQQRRALQRRRAVELALSWRRQPGLRSEPSLGEAWTCPVPWCRTVNRPERSLCMYEPHGCRGLRDPASFARLWHAALRLQHFWRCKLYQLRRSWAALAAAEAATQEKWRRGLVASDDRATQTMSGGMGRLLVTSDATTQAGVEPLRAERDGGFPADAGGERKRPRLQQANARPEPGVMAWQVSTGSVLPTTAEVDRILSSIRRLRRERRVARPPNPPEVPVRTAEPELCGWGCGARLVLGQSHSCGCAAERRLLGPPASPDSTFGPPAPEPCTWCGLPLMLATGESHTCGGRDVAGDANDNDAIEDI